MTRLFKSKIEQMSLRVISKSGQFAVGTRPVYATGRIVLAASLWCRSLKVYYKVAPRSKTNETNFFLFSSNR